MDPTAGGASGEVDGIFDDDPMCMLTTTPVSSQASKNGSQKPEWIEGRPEERRDLAEAGGGDAAGGHAAHLGGGQIGVPQRHDHERDEATVGAGAPLVDLPVVVGLHAGEPELLVVHLGERLPAETRHGREAHLGVGPVDVHVLEAGLLVVAALAHVLVGDGRDGDLFARHTDRCGQPRVRDGLVLEHPPIGQRAFAFRTHLIGELAADEGHLLHRMTLDARADRLELLRQAVLPDVRGLDDVVIDGDDLRDVLHRRIVPRN